MFEEYSSNDDRNFIQKYGWYIVILFITIHYLNRNVITPKLNEREQKKNYKDATEPQRVARLHEEMVKVREEQQRQAQLKSQEAKEKKKLKEIQRLKESRVDQPHSRNSSGGHRLGSGGESSSYNPLMPSSGRTGPSYRPTRRSRPGGG